MLTDASSRLCPPAVSLGGRQPSDGTGAAAAAPLPAAQTAAGAAAARRQPRRRLAVQAGVMYNTETGRVMANSPV